MLEDKCTAGNDITPCGLEKDIVGINTMIMIEIVFTDVQVERSPDDRSEPQGLIKPPKVSMYEPPLRRRIALTPMSPRGEAQQEFEYPNGDE